MFSSPAGAPSFSGLVSANSRRAPAWSIVAPALNWLIIAFCAAFVFFTGASRPTYNWDMIAYVASAYHDEGYVGQELRDKTYDEIKAEVTPQDFQNLTTGAYRDGVYRDPAALEQQLPFYQVKVVYIKLIELLNRFGLTFVQASYLISAFFAAASTVLIGEMLIQFDIYVIALPFLLAATHLYARDSATLPLCSLSTPDAMAGFFALIAIVACYLRSRWFYVVAALLPSIRPDFVILSFLLVGVQVILWGLDRRRSGQKIRLKDMFASQIPGVASAAIALVIYFAINKHYASYGYIRLFNFSFMNFDPYPATMTISHNPGVYVRAYVMGLRNLFESRHLFIYVMFAVKLSRMRLSEASLSAYHLCFAMAPLAFAAIHLVLFPEYEDRFFVFVAACLALWILRDEIDPSAARLNQQA